MSAARQLELTSRYDDAPGERVSIEERWQRFHAENPQVYETFERLALEAATELRSQGQQERIGAKMLYEVMRWRVLRKKLILRTDGDSTPMLNNDYCALYVREFVRRNPRHSRLFEMRIRKA